MKSTLIKSIAAFSFVVLSSSSFATLVIDHNKLSNKLDKLSDRFEEIKSEKKDIIAKIKSEKKDILSNIKSKKEDILADLHKDLDLKDWSCKLDNPIDHKKPDFPKHPHNPKDKTPSASVPEPASLALLGLGLLGLGYKRKKMAQ